MLRPALILFNTLCAFCCPAVHDINYQNEEFILLSGIRIADLNDRTPLDLVNTIKNPQLAKGDALTQQGVWVNSDHVVQNTSDTCKAFETSSFAQTSVLQGLWAWSQCNRRILCDGPVQCDSIEISGDKVDIFLNQERIGCIIQEDEEAILTFNWPFSFKKDTIFNLQNGQHCQNVVFYPAPNHQIGILPIEDWMPSLEEVGPTAEPELPPLTGNENALLQDAMRRFGNPSDEVKRNLAILCRHVYMDLANGMIYVFPLESLDDVSHHRFVKTDFLGNKFDTKIAQVELKHAPPAGSAPAFIDQNFAIVDSNGNPVSIGKSKDECRTIASINYLKRNDYLGLVCPLEDAKANPTGELVPLGTRFPEPFGAAQNYLTKECKYVQINGKYDFGRAIFDGQITFESNHPGFQGQLDELIKKMLISPIRYKDKLILFALNDDGICGAVYFKDLIKGIGAIAGIKHYLGFAKIGDTIEPVFFNWDNFVLSGRDEPFGNYPEVENQEKFEELCAQYLQ